jgi:hypothetical protein
MQMSPKGHHLERQRSNERPQLSSRRKLFIRALVGLPMLGIMPFTTIALAGKPSPK